jgi:hypothetical protein
MQGRATKIKNASPRAKTFHFHMASTKKAAWVVNGFTILFTEPYDGAISRTAPFLSSLPVRQAPPIVRRSLRRRIPSV